GRAAESLRAQEIGVDATLDNDPASNRGHVYWRHPGGDAASEPATGHCYVVLQDATPARPTNLGTFIAAVFALTLLLGAALFKSPGFWYRFPDEWKEMPFRREAMVAVLLVVPGFLSARLDLPPRQSILGRLHGLPRVISYCVIATAAALAAVAAV